MHLHYTLLFLSLQGASAESAVCGRISACKGESTHRNEVTHIRRSSAKIDLTQGPIISRAILFALPICLGSILQQLYTTVDTLVVGNFCGALSLAAVGTSSQPVEIFMCLFMGLGNGVTILVSQATGSRDQLKLRRVVRNANAFVYLCGIPVTILGFLCASLVLRLMQTPADTLPLAISYTQIAFLGTLGTLGYNINAGMLRGMGDSRSSLWFLMISCAANVVLDLFFVAVCRMGVSGAAWATILAQYLSWLCSILYIRRRYPEADYSPLPRSVDREGVMDVIRVSLPLGLNHSIYSVGHLFSQSFVNAQGSVFMAACSVGGRINSLANIAVSSLSSACTSFAGQNLGARRYDRLSRGCWQIPLFSCLLAMGGGVIVSIFSEPLLLLFNQDPAVLAMAKHYVSVTLPWVWMYAMLTSIMNICYGLGIMKYPTAVNVLMLWAVRIPVTWLICTFGNGTDLVYSYPISFACGMLAMLMFYFTHRWKEIRMLARPQPESQSTH